MTTLAGATSATFRISPDVARAAALAGTLLVAGLVVFVLVFAPALVVVATVLAGPAIVLALLARAAGPVDPSTARLVLGVPPAVH